MGKFEPMARTGMHQASIWRVVLSSVDWPCGQGIMLCMNARNIPIRSSAPFGQFVEPKPADLRPDTTVCEPKRKNVVFRIRLGGPSRP
jgi:hypothetical protein